MNTVSNGFCLFNAAACASLYATTPVSQGGLGLRRVCVIDFDVHHGNGTQDILCSAYDPRFLYVSLHAGGAHINGYDGEDSDDESFRLKLGRKKQDAIFPGRCGDSSPHEGVLNIPLGRKVTASAMGAALVSQVSPKVESFSPDLIVLSAGFDAHVNDPLDLGGLTAEDFRSVTEVVCQMAARSCSGRVLSVLEGGYGVPCCQPRDDLFLPNDTTSGERLLQLGSDLPLGMKDEVPFTLRQKLDRCHEEGFLNCVEEHVRGFINSNKR
jgi:acetoin utilization deacetylase AcuC-like enzyme